MPEIFPVCTTGQSPQVATTILETRLVAVTVYPQQARVTRRGRVDLETGDTILIIDELPATLHADSVQARSGGTAQILLQGLQISPRPLPLAGSAASLTLIDRLHKLEDSFRQTKDHIAALTLQRDFLTTLAERAARTFAQGLAQGQADLTTVTELLAYLGQQHTNLGEEIAQKERHKQNLDHQLKEMRQQVQAAQSQSPASDYQVQIPLRTVTPGTLELEIIYGVDGATWDPAYDVRFGSEPDGLQLDHMALVQQHTGEDWTQVSLTLSTAAPDKSPTLPQTQVWYINGTAPNEQGRGGRNRSPILQDTYRMLGALPGSEVPPPEYYAEPNGQGIPTAIAVVSIQAPQPVTIPGDDHPHRIPIGQGNFSGKFTYVSLPYRCDAPYLQAHLTNPPEGVPLLPGVAHLFLDGGYLGQERFDYVAPGQSFQLSLGLDERIQVQRELVQRQTDAVEPCAIILSYRLSFHNPLPHPVKLTVLERIPVSRSDQVQVRLVQAQPTATLKEDGICQWILDLPAETVQQVQYQYTVEYPCEVTVLGLDV